MASSDGYVYVDDRDPRIVYSANWGLSDPSDAYDGTLHGISVAGGTATLTFAGRTTISVVGGVGDVEQYGWPSSSYSIDGKVYATLDEATDLNLNDPSQFIYNFTYWDSPNLSPGEHTLIITTQNGTSPNTYWLDYIRFLPLGSSTSAASTVSSTSPSSAASISRSQSPTNAQASASISSASPQLSATSTSPQTTPINGTGSLPSSSQPASKGTDAVVANTSSHSQHTGAIIGGAIGGAVCLALLAIIGVYLFLKRRLRTEQRGQLFPSMSLT
ncbi:hypothetical protein BD414DRAFT_414651 [Trametes punicea]|nr:hypothetical protein BD414DRAFT_414651 [Trametes punicea]